MTATLAASAAVGLGLGLARVGRERLAARQRARARRLGMLPDEPLDAGLRRMATEQLDLAIEQLSDRNGAGPPEDAVHETRKALKRLRTMLRLLEDALGEEAVAAETTALREVASQLAGARDAEVMLATLDALVDRHPRKLGRASVRRLRGWLVAERERARHQSVGNPIRVAVAIADLHACRLRMQALEIPTGDERKLLEPGLGRIYSQGRRRCKRARACRGERERTLVMHEWRKRVKDLRYLSEMLERRAPPGAFGLTLPASALWSPPTRVNGASRPLRRIARRADELGEVLGEDHDLALLAELARRSGRGAGAGPRLARRPRKALLKAIAKRRRKLRRRAMKDGKRLYGDPTKRFVRRTEKTFARAGAAAMPAAQPGGR